MYRPCGSGLRLGVSSSPWLPSGHITPTSFWFSVSLKKKLSLYPPCREELPDHAGFTIFSFSFIDFIRCMYACPFRMKSFSCPERCGCGWEGESISPEGSSSQRIRGYQTLILLVLMEPEIWEWDALLSTATTTTTTTCCRLDACVIIKPSSFMRH